MYHLFSDLKGRYLYDSNKNKTIRISEGLYNYLKKEDNSQPIDECTLKEYNNLKEEGYFKQIITKIANPARKTFIYLLERSISNLVFQVTQDCNFRCIYCPYCDNDGTH